MTELFAGAVKVTGSLLMYVGHPEGEALQYAPQSIFEHVDGSNFKRTSFYRTRVVSVNAFPKM
ncbi:MAG TPA: hypothetical protein VGP85_16690 [Pyrinomonadaceae bacterium]|nr:hypothetical protein [Pyrinomonadaceae bacterium]